MGQLTEIFKFSIDFMNSTHFDNIYEKFLSILKQCKHYSSSHLFNKHNVSNCYCIYCDELISTEKHFFVHYIKLQNLQLRILLFPAENCDFSFPSWFSRQSFNPSKHQYQQYEQLLETKFEYPGIVLSRNNREVIIKSEEHHNFGCIMMKIVRKRKYRIAKMFKHFSLSSQYRTFGKLKSPQKVSPRSHRLTVKVEIKTGKFRDSHSLSKYDVTNQSNADLVPGVKNKMENFKDGGIHPCHEETYPITGTADATCKARRKIIPIRHSQAKFVSPKLSKNLDSQTSLINDSKSLSLESTNVSQKVDRKRKTLASQSDLSSNDDILNSTQIDVSPRSFEKPIKRFRQRAKFYSKSNKINSSHCIQDSLKSREESSSDMPLSCKMHEEVSLLSRRQRRKKYKFFPTQEKPNSESDEEIGLNISSKNNPPAKKRTIEKKIVIPLASRKHKAKKGSGVPCHLSDYKLLNFIPNINDDLSGQDADIESS